MKIKFTNKDTRKLFQIDVHLKKIKMKKQIIYLGCKINYDIDGKGPALILIHGFTEFPGVWNSFIAELKNSFTIITPALPAHGGSDFPETELTMEFIADSLYKILKQEKIMNAVFVGHSMGGYAMLQFAEKYPQFCKSICLFHSTARADTPEVRTSRDRTIDIIRKNHLGFLNSFIPDLFAEDNREKFENEIQLLISHANSIHTDGLIACMEAMKERQGSIELLALTNIPVGFVIGKQDSRVAFETLLAQSALPRQSHVLILNECGHMGHIEKTKETLNFIRYFASI